MTPNAPTFISTPAWSIDTEVGAAAWPSGDQEWNGNMAPSVPQPMTSSGKKIFWNVSSFGAAISVGTSKVPAPTCVKRAKMTVKMKMEPASSIIISFIAPYSLRVEPHTPIRRYMGMSAIS